MIALYIRLAGHRTGRLAFDGTALAIGSDQQNGLVLRDGEAAPKHCVLELADEGAHAWRVVVLAPLTLDDRPLAPGAQQVARDGASLVLGAYTIVLALQEPALSREPTEARLLADILRGDVPSREVYADWLDERGVAERAEFLRVQEAFVATRDVAHWHRLRELAARPHVDLAWRRRVSRPFIERCGRPGCPLDWGGLVSTARADVRRCGTCSAEVHYCGSRHESRRHGGLVVVDVADRELPERRSPAEPSPGSSEGRRGAPTWDGRQDWRTGAFDELVSAAYPEARQPLRVRSQLPFYGVTLRQHALVRLYFGWGEGMEFESWSGVFVTGELGFARLSQRPEVLSELLAHERYALPEPGLAGDFLVDPLAELMDVVFGIAQPPDTLDREDRNLRMRSGYLSRYRLQALDSGDFSYLGFDPAAWAAVRPRLPGTRFEVGRRSARLTYCTAEAVGGGEMELAVITVEIVGRQFDLEDRRHVVARLPCRALALPVIGRPLQLGGTPHRAPLVTRDDWG